MVKKTIAYIRPGLERFFSDYYCPDCGKKLDYLWLKRPKKEGGWFYKLAMGIEDVFWCKKCKKFWQRTIYGHFMNYSDFKHCFKIKELKPWRAERK